MSAPPADLDSVRASVTRQAGLVRDLKKEGADPEKLRAAIDELTKLRKLLDELSEGQDLGVQKWNVNKKALDECVIHRMFVVPSFEIHGGVSGLYDYGPPGSALKENMLSLWRQHFVLEDNLLQIECTTLTPYAVLKTSGHVDKFEDLMVKDNKTGECFRADKLLEDFIDNLMTKDKEMTTEKRDALRRVAAQAGAYKKAELGAKLAELGITSPTTGNPLTPPFEFNLMFTTSIGPSGNAPGFLRPETAQGMFVNFRRLYDYNNGRLPMGVAQIGSAYRNEIAPRGGLLRVREFTMAEIEFFVDPENKAHAKFDSVKDLPLALFPGEAQTGDGKVITMTTGAAVAAGIINNQTLGYFIARTSLFLTRIGISPAGLRFRQHMRSEMAHYACDCWDAEILMSSGWVECVGIADRSAFDLAVHAKATKTDMSAREPYPEPRNEEIVVVKINGGFLGKTYKAQTAPISEALNALVDKRAEAIAFKEKLDVAGTADLTLADGTVIPLPKVAVNITLETKRVSERKFTPNVIEPSFGIGRILTGVLEHNFSTRAGDEQRSVLSFRPIVAPYKVVVLPLDNRIPRAPVHAIASKLTAAGLSSITDDSGASIGKRYSRCDEIGVPFAITYDDKSAGEGTVTLRERDTCAQIRVPIAELVPLIQSLVTAEAPSASSSNSSSSSGSASGSGWSACLARYKVVTTGEDKAASAGSGTANAAAATIVSSSTAAATNSSASSSSSSAPATASHSASSSSVPASTASSNSSTAAKVATEKLVVEGLDRPYGRFHRPA